MDSQLETCGVNLGYADVCYNTMFYTDRTTMQPKGSDLCFTCTRQLVAGTNGRSRGAHGRLHIATVLQIEVRSFSVVLSVCSNVFDR